MKRVIRIKLAFVLISLVAFAIFLFCIIQLHLTKRYSANVNESITVTLKHYDLNRYAFLDPNTSKTLTLANKHSGAKRNLEFVSESWELYFYVRESNAAKTLTVIDPWLGGNTYDHATLERLNTDRDYLSMEGWAKGLQFLDTIKTLGEPALHFNGERFISGSIVSSR